MEDTRFFTTTFIVCPILFSSKTTYGNFVLESVIKENDKKENFKMESPLTRGQIVTQTHQIKGKKNCHIPDYHFS